MVQVLEIVCESEKESNNICIASVDILIAIVIASRWHSSDAMIHKLM